MLVPVPPAFMLVGPGVSPRMELTAVSHMEVLSSFARASCERTSVSSFSSSAIRADVAGVVCWDCGWEEDLEAEGADGCGWMKKL